MVLSEVSRRRTHKFLHNLLSHPLSPRWVGDEMAKVVENEWLAEGCRCPAIAWCRNWFWSS